MAVTLVQSQSNFLGSGNTTLAQAFGSDNTAGNLLVCVGGVYPTTNTQGVSDSQGNTWVSVFSGATSFNLRYQVWVAANCKAGANTVTTQNNGSGQAYMTMQIAEFSGFTASGQADQSTSNTGTTSTSMDSGSKTTVQNGELILGYGSANNAILDPGGQGSGFTKLAWTDGDEFEYQVQTSAGSISATMTANSGVANWFMIMVTVATTGLSLSASVNDSATVSESVTSAKIVNPTVSDSTSATTESAAVVKLSEPNVNDGLSLGEAVTVVTGAETLSVSDSVNASELLTELVVTSVIANDAASGSDAVTVSPLAASGISVSEAPAVAESVTVLASLRGPSVSDSLAVAESVAAALINVGSTADSVTVSETVSPVVVLKESVSDALTGSESVTVAVAAANVVFAAVYESVGASEAVTIIADTASASLADTVSADESVVPVKLSFAGVSDASAVTEDIDVIRPSPGEAVDHVFVDEGLSLAVGVEGTAADTAGVTESLSVNGIVTRLVFVLDSSVSSEFTTVSPTRVSKFIWIQGNGIGDGQGEPAVWAPGNGSAGYTP